MNEKQKIILIMPYVGMEKRYGKGFNKIGSLLPPLGLLYISSSLKNAGYDVELIDMELKQLNDEYVIKKIINEGDNLVIGIYCNTSSKDNVIRLIKKIKEHTKSIVIVGGPHATVRPLELTPYADFVVIGEGEITIVELLNEINKEKPEYNKVKGIAYKNIITEERPLINNLDELPFPDREIINISDYRPSPNQYKQTPCTTMMCSRGCPYDCSFCQCKQLWTRKYRVRSVDNVMREIKKVYYDYKINDISFFDDIWGINKEWVREFCDKMIQENMMITWSCDARINTVDQETLLLMKKAGCWAIFYGVESLDQDILNAINKNVNVNSIMQTLDWTKNAGIEIKANFMIGLPGSTPEKDKATVKSICIINPDYVKFNIFTPYPDTEAYKQIVNGGWGDLTEDFSKCTHYFPTFKPSGYNSLKEVSDVRRYAHRKFFLRPRYIIKKILSIKSKEDIKRYFNGLRAIISI